MAKMTFNNFLQGKVVDCIQDDGTVKEVPYLEYAVQTLRDIDYLRSLYVSIGEYNTRYVVVGDARLSVVDARAYVRQLHARADRLERKLNNFVDKARAEYDAIDKDKGKAE